MNEQAITQIFARTLYALLRAIINCGSFPLGVMLRKDMGERYCSFIKAAFSSILIHCFMDFNADVLLGISGRAWDRVEAIVQIVFWMCYILNRLDIREKRRKAIKWHSYCIGRPRFFADSHWNQKFLLPGTALAVAVLCYVIKGWIPVTGVSNLLLFTGIFMFCEYVLIEYKARIKYLDAVDMEIEADQLSDALKGAPIENTHGYFIPNILTPAERESAGESRIKKMYSALDPKLKDLIHNQEDEARKNRAENLSA